MVNKSIVTWSKRTQFVFLRSSLYMYNERGAKLDQWIPKQNLISVYRKWSLWAEDWTTKYCRIECGPLNQNRTLSKNPTANQSRSKKNWVLSKWTILPKSLVIIKSKAPHHPALHITHTLYVCFSKIWIPRSSPTYFRNRWSLERECGTVRGWRFLNFENRQLLRLSLRSPPFFTVVANLLNLCEIQSVRKSILKWTQAFELEFQN